jgi:formylglycine-generating enzyme required for sulfatase activity
MAALALSTTVMAIGHVVGALIAWGAVETSHAPMKSLIERADQSQRRDMAQALGIPLVEFDDAKHHAQVARLVNERFSSELLRNRLSDLCGLLLRGWWWTGAVIQLGIFITVCWLFFDEGSSVAIVIWGLPATAFSFLLVRHSAWLLCKLLTGRFPGEARARRMRLDLPEMKWATIPAGQFTMGALLAGEESQRRDGSTVESPQHVVTLTRPFEILTTPVSEALWLQVMFKGNWAYWIAHKELATAWWLPKIIKTSLRPFDVSWNDAIAFCNALSRLAKIDEAYLVNEDGVYWEGPAAIGYRLPTEAEWEYACRAGDDFDDTIRTDLQSSIKRLEDDLEKTSWNAAASIRPPNVFGVSGMEDGIYEWCWDSEGAKHLYHGTDETDPLGPDRTGQQEPTKHRVIRKGPFRSFFPKDKKSFDLGFRPVRTIGGLPSAPKELTYEYLSERSLGELVDDLLSSQSSPTISVNSLQALSRRLVDIAYIDELTDPADRSKAAKLEETTWRTIEEALCSHPKSLESRRRAREAHLQQARQYGAYSLFATIDKLPSEQVVPEIVKPENWPLLPDFPIEIISTLRGPVLKELIRARAGKQLQKAQWIRGTEGAVWDVQAANMVTTTGWLIVIRDPTALWLLTTEEQRDLGNFLNDYTTARSVLLTIGAMEQREVPCFPQPTPEKMHSMALLSSADGDTRIEASDLKRYEKSLACLNESARGDFMTIVFGLRLMIWEKSIRSIFGPEYLEAVRLAIPQSPWAEEVCAVVNQMAWLYDQSLIDERKNQGFHNFLTASFVLDILEDEAPELRTDDFVQSCAEIFVNELFHFPPYVRFLISFMAHGDSGADRAYVEDALGRWP